MIGLRWISSLKKMNLFKKKIQTAETIATSELNCLLEKKLKFAKTLFGGPAEPFRKKPEGRVEVVSFPIKNGVAVKGVIVNVTGTEFSWRVNGIFIEDSRLFIEVEKEVDSFFKSTVPLSYMKKDWTLPLHSTPDVHFDKNFTKLNWAYSNLKYLLIYFCKYQSRIRDFEKDIAPSCSVLMHAIGIPAETGSVTYILKEKGQFSPAVWDTNGTKLRMGLLVLFRWSSKSTKLAVSVSTKILMSTALSCQNYKTISSYWSHSKEKISKSQYLSV